VCLRRSLSLQVLVADDLVLELQLQLQQFNFFRVFFYFILEAINLPCLRALRQNCGSHREVPVDIANVPKCEISSEVGHLLLQSLDLFDVLFLLLSKLLHIEVVQIDVNIVYLYFALIQGHVLFGILHISEDLLLRLFILLLIVFLPYYFIFFK